MSYDSQQIENLRKVYNEENPHQTPIPEGTMDDVWDELKIRFHKKCKTGTSTCIMTSMLSKPKGPDSWILNPEEWLSSDDIESLENKFMKLFTNYNFLGSFPIDFDKRNKTGTCLVSFLCSLDIKTLYSKKYTQIGIVFNTDVSTGKGEHWIAIFCDIRPELEFPRITYFDSYGQSPEKEIKILMRRWKEGWDSTKIHSKPMVMSFNKIKHQYENSECGMYCLYFHYCCLMNIPMDERIPDNFVRWLRGLLFRVGKK
jgi:hypothetical protein